MIDFRKRNQFQKNPYAQVDNVYDVKDVLNKSTLLPPYEARLFQTAMKMQGFGNFKEFVVRVNDFTNIFDYSSAISRHTILKYMDGIHKKVEKLFYLDDVIRQECRDSILVRSVHLLVDLQIEVLHMNKFIERKELEKLSALNSWRIK